LATEIICIVADEDRIRFLGAANWTKDEGTVIAEVEEGQEFFVEKELARFRLIVARDRDDRKYLRTDPNETSENNLLRLPICP
jgi:hypothetical protein